MPADKKKGPRKPPASAPQNTLSAIVTRIASIRDTLGATGQRIVDFIASHPEEVVHMSVSEVADRTGASEGSVVGAL